MAQKLVENTDPHDQRLFNESYSERSVGPQGLAGVGFCGFEASYKKVGFFINFKKYETNFKVLAVNRHLNALFRYRSQGGNYYRQKVFW
jgi:hypothetical protein